MYAEVSKRETEQFERATIVAALRWLCDPLRTMDNLQVGDVVQLKSGGPAMTINRVLSDQSFACQWFDKDGALKNGMFQSAQLKKFEPREPQESEGSFGTRTY
jgi:uncharacterized protein YodC (DUF2158 family)